MELSIAVLSVFAIAAAAPGIYRVTGRTTGAVLSLLPFSLTVYLSTFIPRVASGETFSVNLTAPVAAHMMGRAACFIGVLFWKETMTNCASFKPCKVMAKWWRSRATA
jgi:multisubunit Na+/H+ antiporter MnhG subunit